MRGVTLQHIIVAYFNATMNSMENTPIRATRKDKRRFVDILATSFASDPHVGWLAGAGPGKEKRLRLLMEFAFEQGLANGEAYMSPDKNAVAIWRRGHKNRFSPGLGWLYLKFMAGMGMRRINRITQLDKELHAHYPGDGSFLYLWLLGVDPAHQGKGLSSLMLNRRLRATDRSATPTYLETSRAKNVSIYQRKGFEVYHQIELDPTAGTTVYLMRRIGVPANAQDPADHSPSDLPSPMQRA
jgi:GNAT superfamily N-acetyltransferase